MLKATRGPNSLDLSWGRVSVLTFAAVNDFRIIAQLRRDGGEFGNHRIQRRKRISVLLASETIGRFGCSCQGWNIDQFLVSQGLFPSRGLDGSWR